jgi:hypothetical protein
MLLKSLNRHRLLGRHKRFCRKLSKQIRHLSRLRGTLYRGGMSSRRGKNNERWASFCVSPRRPSQILQETSEKRQQKYYPGCA